MENIPEHEIRRNFGLGVFNGAGFQFAEALINPPLVLTWFVSYLTSSNLLVGLIAPLGDAGWFLPQIFVSARIQRLERKMPAYTASAAIRVGVWGLLALAVWTVKSPALLLLTFFTLYAAARLASGLAGLAFFDIVAKTIPANRRGLYFGWRQLLGGLLGLGGAWIVRMVLNAPTLPFPRGHALLFALYGLVLIPSLGAFMLVREPPGQAVALSMTVQQQIRQAGQLLRENHVYRRYLLARIALILAGITLPFYGIYAKNVLGATGGILGIYIAVHVAAQLLFNLPWGRLSDRRGNRLVMRLVSLLRAGTTSLSLGLIGCVTLLRLEGDWLPYLVIPLFFLDGATWPALEMVGSNFLLELVPEGQRMLYLGFSNTLLGLFTLLSGLGGVIVDWFGFAGLFATSLGLYVAAYALTTGLPEPRGQKDGRP